MTAADLWRRHLEAWAIPQDLLDAVDESPYGWPPELWKRRSQQAAADPDEPHTLDVVRRLLPRGGSVLDVGAGRGRASLPLVVEGHRLVAVEKDPGMAAGLREDAAEIGVQADVVEGSWPEVADRIPDADVAMCAHVVYDVQDIVPFLVALAEHADAGVVVELTETHPWSELAPLYLALHGLERPAGPTADDLAHVVEETFGRPPQVDHWERPGRLWFADWGEILETYGRRLVLPRKRREELRDLMEDRVVEEEGRLFVGSAVRSLVTMWWEP